MRRGGQGLASSGVEVASQCARGHTLTGLWRESPDSPVEASHACLSLSCITYIDSIASTRADQPRELQNSTTADSEIWAHVAVAPEICLQVRTYMSSLLSALYGNDD